jgi:ssDNA-binding Zn-finger/Zn-ribbon topoisomerase 1
LPTNFNSKEERVARKTILVCDKCGKEVDEEKGAVLRVTFADARRTSKQADLCETCAGGMPGRAVARRGRRPKSAAAA